ncbi:MAG: molecular chaperone [Burkholderiaceae bacterium]
MHTDEPKFPWQVSDEPGATPPENARGDFVVQSDEELARASFYGLMATLLLAPPSADLLHALATADPIAGETGELESAWEQLVLVAGIMDADAVREEFDALFVSTGTPLINPHASLYLSGFMMDRPLAALRDALRELGLARQGSAVELEDHLGSLFETMALLIQQGRGIRTQRAFFNEHIAGWADACLEDIRDADKANFYVHVAQLIQSFLFVERNAFEMGGG